MFKIVCMMVESQMGEDSTGYTFNEYTAQVWQGASLSWMHVCRVIRQYLPPVGGGLNSDFFSFNLSPAEPGYALPLQTV